MKYLLIFISLNCFSQVDIGADLSLGGIFTEVKYNYAFKETYVLGAAFAYNFYNPNVHQRIDLVLGYKLYELTFELDMGFIRWHQLTSSQSYQYQTLSLKERYLYPNPSWIFHADIGTKMYFSDQYYLSMQASYPLFFKFGLGFRFFEKMY